MRRLYHDDGGIGRGRLIVLVVTFVMVVANATFFGKVLDTYALTWQTAAPLASLPVTFGALMVLALAVLAVGPLTRPVLIVYLNAAAFAAYFMDSFGVVINTEMFDNVAQTNTAEALDLLNPRLLGYWLAIGVIPGALVWRARLRQVGWIRAAGSRIGLVAGAVAVLVGLGGGFGSFYASFIREHKPLRSYANPGYPIYAAVRYFGGGLADREPVVIQAMGTDVHKVPRDMRRKLLVVVVGETARADHFSLNGYGRDTNPRLAGEDGISLTRVRSCGTSTAVSVPCMFSFQGQAHYDAKTARAQENVLDVMARGGVAVLWLDNNSDSKGVALRVPYENFREPGRNTVCDVECRDVGMLPRVRSFVTANPDRDVAVVLHSMGNHGPAYFKRYPPEFEVFKPACLDNDLSRCAPEAIINAYDNAIRYTDHFLAETIALLKDLGGERQTAMLYMSDHGESLGEGGTWLHGLPLSIAPDAQTHVPAIIWLGGVGGDVDLAALRAARDTPWTHDALVHTVLGLMSLQTSLYQRDLDILAPFRHAPP